MTCLSSPQPPSEMTDMRCQRCGRWLYLFAACLHLASTNMCRSQRFVRQVGAMSSAEVMHGTSDGAGEREMHVMQSCMCFKVNFQAAYCLGGEVACVLTRGWLSWLSSVFVGAAWQKFHQQSGAVVSTFQLQPLDFHSVYEVPVPKASRDIADIAISAPWSHCGPIDG